MTVSDLALESLAGAGTVIVAIVAARAAHSLGLPALLGFLGLGLAPGGARAGIRFSDPGHAEGFGLAALALVLAEGRLTTNSGRPPPVVGWGAPSVRVGRRRSNRRGAHWRAGDGPGGRRHRGVPRAPGRAARLGAVPGRGDRARRRGLRRRFAGGGERLPRRLRVGSGARQRSAAARASDAGLRRGGRLAGADRAVRHARAARLPEPAAVDYRAGTSGRRHRGVPRPSGGRRGGAGTVAGVVALAAAEGLAPSAAASLPAALETASKAHRSRAGSLSCSATTASTGIQHAAPVRNGRPVARPAAPVRGGPARAAAGQRGDNPRDCR